MKEFGSFKMVINNDGNSFYSKWKRDTILSTFVVAPAMFLFYLLCTTLIVGMSVKLILILLIPIILIIIGLVYSPYFLRGKYINHMVKGISFDGSVLSIETYKWFTYNAIYISSKIENTQFSESSNESFFKGRKTFLLFTPNLGTDTFYIVSDFFDNIDDNLKSLIDQGSN